MSASQDDVISQRVAMFSIAMSSLTPNVCDTQRPNMETDTLCVIYWLAMCGREGDCGGGGGWKWWLLVDH